MSFNWQGPQPMAVRLRIWPRCGGGAKLRGSQRKKMAAVAAEPGAAAVSTGSTSAMDDEGPPEPGPGPPGVPLQSEGPRDSGPAVELLLVRVEDGGDGEERRHDRPELEPAAGKALCGNVVTDELINNVPVDRVSLDRFAPGLPGDPESGGNVSVQAVYRSILPDPQPSAVFLHSFPAPPPVTEAGLSLAEPAVPTTNVTTDGAKTAGRDRGHMVLVQTELRPGPAEEARLDGNADRLSGPVSPDGLDPETGFIKNTAGNEEPPSPPCRSPKRRLLTDKQEDSSRLLPEPGPLASFQDLSPGSEVRVCLDHVIDDALVVSFRRGEQVFSGVLMDVSRRWEHINIIIYHVNMTSWQETVLTLNKSTNQLTTSRISNSFCVIFQFRLFGLYKKQGAL